MPSSINARIEESNCTANRALFQTGEYIPLETHGSKQDHLRAFARLLGEQVTVSVVPRLVALLTEDQKKPPVGSDVWGDTRVIVPSWRPGSQYRNLFTGETWSSQTVEERQMLPVGELLETYPVVILERLT